MRPALAILTWAAAFLVSPAGATTSGDLCANAQDPCVIACGNARVTAAATLDFGQCDLVLTANARLRVRAGIFVRILARSMRLAPGAQIDGTGDAQTSGATIWLQATGAVTVESGATVDVSGSNGGTLLVRAGGNAGLGGALTATALANAGRGGLIGVTAGGAITVDRPIDVSGGTGDGGDIDLDGATVTVNASLTLDGASPGGGGGDFTANASRGTLTLAAPISASGARGTANTGGGSGGDVGLTASGDIRFVSGITLDATGAGPDGDGGRIDADAAAAIVQQGAISASTVGSGGGGSISLTGRTLSSSGTLTATGGSGGDVDLAAVFAATVASTIDASSTGGDGDGGGITVRGNPLLVTGVLAANGDTWRDIGGSVTLTGCGVTLAASGELDSKGVRGLNLLQASGTTVVSGTLNAAPSGGNRLEYRDQPPTIAARSINPAPVVARNAALPACPGTVPTTTTSTTTSSVTMPSRASTSTTTSTSVTSSTRPPGATTTTRTTASTLATTTSVPGPSTSVTTSTSATTPQTACAPLDCDDANGCTMDACVAGECEHTFVEDIDTVTCRLDDLVADVSATPVGRTTATIRERLLAKISATRRVVERARPLGRRRPALLGRADRRLKALVQFVERARAIDRLDSDLGTTIALLVEQARAAIVLLR